MLIIYVLIAAAIIAADQLVKIWICSNVVLNDTFLSLGLFDFTYVKNTGAAFSILRGNVPVLSVVSIVFCVGVVVYWIKKKPSNPYICLALTLMFAGAAGNAIDRLSRGFVVDFIRTTFVNFPIFNIADMAITVGAVIMVLYVFVSGKDEE